MRRVVVVGNSGSGKTTLAKRLAGALGVPWVELDAIFHQPDWTELPDYEFHSRVDAATSRDGWVVDGNYHAVRDLVWARPDTVVWLDLPRRVVMRRIVWRSLSRAVLRRELWNGNRERLRNLASIDPQTSIIAWSWVKHDEYRQRYTSAMSDNAWAHLSFLRVRSARAARRLVKGSRRYAGNH